MGNTRFYRIHHRADNGEMISESYLREADNETESPDFLYEVIRRSPEFGWCTDTANRRWGMHWVNTRQKGITVQPLTELPEHVLEKLQKLTENNHEN